MGSTSDNPHNVDFALASAEVKGTLAAFYMRRNQPETAITYYRTSVEQLSPLRTANASSTQLLTLMADGHEGVGLALSKLNDPNKALGAFKDSLSIWESLVEARPSNDWFANEAWKRKTQVAAIHMQLGSDESLPTQERLEHWKVARSHFKASLRSVQTLSDQKKLGQSHKTVGFEMNTAIKECSKQVRILEGH